MSESDLKVLLESIKKGEMKFETESVSEADIIAFQPTAKLLKYAYDQGYLEGYLPVNENMSGFNRVVMVTIQNGLTYEGEMFLTAKPA